MARRTSAAALHAARVVMEKNILTLKPPETLSSGAIYSLTASEAHVAILIDSVTSVFEVSLLRPKLRYWQQRVVAGTAEAGQIAYFAKELIDALQKVPGHRPDDPVVDRGLSEVRADMGSGKDELQRDVTDRRPLRFCADRMWSKIPLTRAAIEAGRTLFWYYEITLRKKPVIYDEALHRLDVAKSVDVALGLAKAHDALPLMQYGLKKLTEGQMTLKEVRALFRRVGVLLESIPTYQEREDEVKLLV
jgi:hypothetical protein